MITLTVLAENTAGKNCLAEHGLSYLIEADQTVLFDTGASDLFLRNAQKLQIDMDSLETVVLSHGHDDHTGGISFLKNKKLIAHPDLFVGRFRKTDQTPLGFPMQKATAEQNFELVLTRGPLQISEQIWFLGEVPRLNDFEAKETAFRLADGSDDWMMDDSALAITTPQGLIIVSGCAHAGICNTVEHAISTTQQQNVLAIIGGFHLKANDQLTRTTIDYLKKRKVRQVIPGHCTMLPALCAFYAEWNFVPLRTGNVLRF